MKLRNFEDLASESHDIEISIATSRGQNLPMMKLHKSATKQEVKKWVKATPKTEMEEAFAISTKSCFVVPIKIDTSSKKNEVKEEDFNQELESND